MVVYCVEEIVETGARWWHEGHKGLSRLGPQRCIIPYVLRLMIYCLGIRMNLFLRRVPAALIEARGVGLQIAWDLA
jgi:hypothetical protein